MIMNMDEVVSQTIMDLDLRADSKQAALEKLTDLLYADGRIRNKEGFLKEVLKREETETTDLGFGVAIPHGMTDMVKQASVAIGKLETPIFWDGKTETDNEPIFAIFLMATSPDAKGRAHIEIISQVASLLIEDTFVAFLKDNQDKDKLFDQIQKYLGDS